MPKLTLLVLAAGMGSRYGGLKQVDPMGPSGETLLDYSVFDALRAGFERVVFIIRRDIEAEFREKIGSRYQGNVSVDYVFQQLDFLPEGFSVPADRKKPWGTAHAIWCAREALTEPFAAINADDFYGRETYEVVGRFLKAAAPESPHFAMAGYRLGSHALRAWLCRSRCLPGGCETAAYHHRRMHRNRTRGKRDPAEGGRRHRAKVWRR